MRELSLIVAIVAALAVTIVLAQEELKPAAPAPAAAEPAGAPAARANPFSPLDSGAAPAPGSASLPPLETSPAQAAAVSQTATPATAKLNGILYCESKPLVVINDLIAGVGDEVAGMRVTAIARDKVTLAGPRGVWVMTPLQPEARLAHPRAPGSPAGLPAGADSQRPASGAANPHAPGSPAGLPADADSQRPAPRQGSGQASGAANPETTDQPIGKENQ